MSFSRVGPRCTALVALCMCLASCSGGGGSAATGSTGTGGTSAITSVSVSCSPSTIQVNQTSQCSATVVGTGNFSSSVTWSVDNGTINQSGEYTAPGSPTTATVKATSTQDPTKSGTATITIKAAPQAASISISPTNAAVALGNSFQFSLNVTGNPSPSVSCSVNGAGSVQVSGTTAMYSVPLPLPVSFSATLDCSASNPSGTAKASSEINLQYPIPTITTISPTSLDSLGAVIFTIQINGSGFYPGGVLHLDPYGDLTLPQGTDAQQVTVGLGLGTTGPVQTQYSPGWLDISASSPPGGPGGGTSNIAHFALLEPFNSLVTNGSTGTQLMLAGDSLYQYDLTTGSLGAQASGVYVDVNGLAQDDKGGNILVSTYATIANVAILDPSLNSLAPAASEDGNSVAAVAAGSGFGCVSVPAEHGISIFPVTSPLILPPNGSQVVSIGPGTQTGSDPGPTAMTTLNRQPACIVFDRSDLTLSAVQVTDVLGVPGTQLLTTAQAPNLHTNTTAQLATFNSGPSQGASVLLSDADKELVFDDLSKGQEIRRVNLTGLPFDVVTDNVLGVAIVAIADPTAGLTRFQSVDPATGAVTSLPITSKMLATGMEVSSDGTKLFLANRDHFQIVPLPLATMPTPSVAVSPTPVTLAGGTAQQFSAKVTGILDSRVVWSVNGVAGGNTTIGLITPDGLYIAPTVSPSPSTVNVQAASLDNSNAIGTASITISSGAVGSPQVSLSDAEISVELGSSTVLTLTTSGSGITATGCAVSGPGTVQLNGGQVTYTAPLQKPSSFSATVTCHATNSVGTESATVLISLVYPTPSISTVTPVVVCPRGCTPTFTITGAGFYPGGTVQVAPLGNIPIPANSTPNHISVQLNLEPFTYGSNFSPGWLDFSVVSPTDHPGGGQSNTLTSVFLSAFNTAWESANFPGAFWQLDQSTGDVVGQAANGNGTGSIPFFAGLTIYDASGAPDFFGTSFGAEIGTEDAGVYVLPPNGGPILLSSIDKPLDVAATNGSACVSQDQNGMVTGIDTTQTSLPTTSVAIGGVPWSVAMASPSSSETDCVVFDAKNSVLSVLKMPDLTPVESMTLTGLTSLSQVTTPPDGGWQLAVFNSGPAAGTAALLSQADNVVVFVNLSTGVEIRRVTLSGFAIRIAPDEADGSLIVATANPALRLTSFQKIDIASGTISTLQTTSPLLATGLGVSPDGTELFVGMRSQYQVLPNQ